MADTADRTPPAVRLLSDLVALLSKEWQVIATLLLRDRQPAMRLCISRMKRDHGRRC